MERRVPRVAALWGVATAACIAGYHLVYKVALDAGAAPAAVFAVAVTVAAPAQALVNRVTPRVAAKAWRLAPGTTTAAGVLCTISFVVFLIALRGGGAGAVLTLRNTSVVFALVFASFLGERASPRQMIGAALVVAGAVLVGLG
jgi:drug/metabolite transporter (DMT)-like permease